MMKASEILDLSAELIAIPSLSNDEGKLVSWLSRYLESLHWQVERIAVPNGREDILVSFGTPSILFTTHLDVVPGPKEIFKPRRDGGRLYGRGACDAKGIAATMIGTCSNLLQRGHRDFGLLFVVGEEWDGSGAKAAAKLLGGRGIRYLINGEPTNGTVASGHKGFISVDIEFKGRSAHSGYPECGIDANAKLIRTATRLLAADFGSDRILGKSTVHCGQISGGIAGNVISPSAALSCSVRTVSSNEEALAKVQELCTEAAEVKLTYDCPAVPLRTVPGLPSAPVSFATDIPNFAPLGAQALLFGPGSILVAHTDDESISTDEIESALEGYQRIFDHLRDELKGANA